MKKLLIFIFILGYVGILYGKSNKEPFHEIVKYVDMDKFVGDWYVISLIPTSFEKNASNGIENYSINEKGVIKVKYTYVKGGKDKIMYQKGWIYNKETNSDWRVRPLWPLKLPYYIMELDDNYSYTVIGTNNYKYLWIMSRTPVLEKEILDTLVNRMVKRGFDKDKIIKMPQMGE